MNRKQREIKRRRENQRRAMAKTVEHKEVQAAPGKRFGWTRNVSWEAV